MFIPEFVNAFPEIGYNTAHWYRLSVLRPEWITIKRKFSHRSALVMDSSEVRGPAFKARDPGSSFGPG